MKDVLRRGREEIDNLKNKLRDSGTLCQHLQKVQSVHEERIADLTTRLKKELASNISKETNIKNMKANVESIQENTVRSKAQHKVLLYIIEIGLCDW